MVLLTLARVSTHKLALPAEQLARSRNTAVVAAYVTLHANCTDVERVLLSVNATSPLPDTPTSVAVVWCGDQPREVPLSWRG